MNPVLAAVFALACALVGVAIVDTLVTDLPKYFRARRYLRHNPTPTSYCPCDRCWRFRRDYGGDE